MSLLVSHIYVMARRYRRRRYGRRRRPRRRFRRRRAMLRRRRMLRGHRRGGRRFTVSIQRDFSLDYGSRVPAATQLVGDGDKNPGPGGVVGIDAGGFRTYSILALPPDLYDRKVGFQDMVGVQWASDNTYRNRLIGVGNGQTAMLTDLPQYIWSSKLPTFFNCNNLWELCEEYRIAWIALSFTVAENNSQANRHLYLEWTNLPAAKAPQWSDLDGTVVPETYQSGNLDCQGFNWMCRPIDIAMACSPAGRNSKLNGWHRSLLSYTHPVTIRYRPRHADMTIDNNPDISPDTSNGNKPKITLVDQFSQSGRLTRGYLPTGQATVTTNEQVWFGPVIRLVDANKSRNIQPNETTYTSLYNEYGVRCTMTAVLRMRAKTCNDPVFPFYTVD
uniref:Cap n=1 Tax=Circular ssDNA virus sp. TaxID=2805939 RepID=A0A2Z4BYV8_9VIRU|nr:MAG: Cap [Circular ssDNA virus sp.]